MVSPCFAHHWKKDYRMVFSTFAGVIWFYDRVSSSLLFSSLLSFSFSFSLFFTMPGSLPPSLVAVVQTGRCVHDFKPIHQNKCGRHITVYGSELVRTNILIHGWWHTCICFRTLKVSQNIAECMYMYMYEYIWICMYIHVSATICEYTIAHVTFTYHWENTNTHHTYQKKQKHINTDVRTCCTAKILIRTTVSLFLLKTCQYTCRHICVMSE